jgi:hypothetical protein
MPMARGVQGKSEMVSQVLDDDAVLVRGEGVGDGYQPVDQFGGQAAEVHRLELLDRLAAVVCPGQCAHSIPPLRTDFARSARRSKQQVVFQAAGKSVGV